MQECRFLSEILISFIEYPGMGLLDHMVVQFLIFEVVTIFHYGYIILLPSLAYKSFLFSHILTNICCPLSFFFFFFFIIAVLTSVRRYCGFSLHLLDISCCCLWFLYLIQEMIAKINVKNIFTYVFFQDFHGFRSYI